MKEIESIEKKHKSPPEVVSLTQPYIKSFEGKYFIGQGEPLTFGQGVSAWGGLFNPINSGVILHVNVFTITNLSNEPFISQIWFNASPLDEGIEATKISPTNTAILPFPIPKVKLLYRQTTQASFQDGVNVFIREVPALTTIRTEEDGKLIMPPGGSFITLLTPPENNTVKAVTAFGWWEERIKI